MELLMEPCQTGPMHSNIQQEHVIVKSLMFNTTVAPRSDCIDLQCSILLLLHLIQNLVGVLWKLHSVPKHLN
jgi:hypothetical protein